MFTFSVRLICQHFFYRVPTWQHSWGDANKSLRKPFSLQLLIKGLPRLGTFCGALIPRQLTAPNTQSCSDRNPSRAVCIWPETAAKRLRQQTNHRKLLEKQSDAFVISFLMLCSHFLVNNSLQSWWKKRKLREATFTERTIFQAFLPSVLFDMFFVTPKFIIKFNHFLKRTTEWPGWGCWVVTTLGKSRVVVCADVTKCI